eukprot:9367-Heterococcus_DN1.PRE.6
MKHEARRFNKSSRWTSATGSGESHGKYYLSLNVLQPISRVEEVNLLLATISWLSENRSTAARKSCAHVCMQQTAAAESTLVSHCIAVEERTAALYKDTSLIMRTTVAYC